MFLKNFFKYYLPTLFWLGVIFYFSSLADLRYRTGDISSEIFLRKGAHFLEYALLAWLFWRIFFVCHQLSWQKSFFLSFLSTTLFALSDEWHQSFVVGRSGKIIDALYDILSSLIFLQSQIFFQKRSWRRGLILLVAIGSLLLLEKRMIQDANEYRARIKQEKTLLIEEQSTKKIAPVEAEKPSAPVVSSEPPTEEKTISTPTPAPTQPTPVSVPFTSQAPQGIWDEYHEEACEEASLLMVAYYLQGKKLDKIQAEKEIQALIAFQIKNYGEYKDSSVAETIRLGQAYFGLKNLKAIYDFSLEDLKKYLAQGQPIIVPAAGRLLKNPFFTAPGPLYHNLVLVGYEKGVIITNDPGTRRGEGYRYDENILYSAIHDFTGDKEKIEKGRKAMIVIE